MGNYKIYEIPNDIPVVSMSGNFTLTDLESILDEMYRLYNADDPWESK